MEAAKSGFRAIGFDTNPGVVERVGAGESHIQDVPSEFLNGFVASGLVSATTDLGRLAQCDAIAICVPTPLSKIKDPELS